MATMSGKPEGIHQLDKDTYPPADSDDDDSFVVLDSCCPPNAAIAVEPISTSSIERSLSSISDILSKQSMMKVFEENKENITEKPQSFVSISGEDIQRSVDNLLVENTRLKDTLAQNNLTMKTQVEKVKTWQDEVLKVQEAHKKKFAEMKKMVQELQAENKKLKTENEVNQENDKKEMTRSQENSNATRKTDNYMQFELEAAKQKIREMEKALDIIITEKQQLSVEMSGYKTEIANYREELQKIQSERTDKSLWVVTESDISQQMETLRLECKNLKKANEELDENAKECVVELSLLHEKFEQKEKELREAQAHISKLTIECDRTRENLSRAEENVKLLRETSIEAMDEKAAEIEDLKASKKKLEDSVSDLRNQYSALKESHSQKVMSLVSAEFSIRELTQSKHEAEQKLAEASEEVGRVRDTRVSDLKQKNEEIQALTKKMTGMQVVDDELTALRTQLDLYKRDYETERVLRNEVMTEKNRMADELQMLQRRNEQLIDEVDQLRSGFVPVRNEDASTAPSPEHSPLPDRYACPICNKRFRSILLLQDHVEFCLPR